MSVVFLVLLIMLLLQTMKTLLTNMFNHPHETTRSTLDIPHQEGGPTYSTCEAVDCSTTMTPWIASQDYSKITIN